MTVLSVVKPKQYKTFPASSPVAGYEYDSKTKILRVHYRRGLRRGTFRYHGVARADLKDFLSIKPSKRFKYLKRIFGEKFVYTYTPLPELIPQP